MKSELTIPNHVTEYFKTKDFSGWRIFLDLPDHPCRQTAFVIINNDGSYSLLSCLNGNCGRIKDIETLRKIFAENVKCLPTN